MMQRFLIFMVFLVFSSISTFAQIPTDSLVAYYPFNGNANDESGNGNNGIVNGATLTADRFGNANSAYSFDGVSNYIEVADNSTLNFGTNDFSISMWLKYPSQVGGTSDYACIITKSDASLYWNCHFCGCSCW